MIFTILILKGGKKVTYSLLNTLAVLQITK